MKWLRRLFGYGDDNKLEEIAKELVTEYRYCVYCDFCGEAAVHEPDCLINKAKRALAERFIYIDLDEYQ